MMAATIDLAARRAVAAGARHDHLAGLDNFCWPDPVQSAKTPDGEYKLAQLVRANQALYDYCKAFKIPCVSGKDSMKNDSTRGGRKISIPPTVLFSVIGKVDAIGNAVTFDFKEPGDIVYVVGLTKAELGGGEFLAMLGHVGNAVPKVDPDTAIKLCEAVSGLTSEGLARSIHAPGPGGLAISFAKMAMAGRLGVEIDLMALPTDAPLAPHELLYSESASRFVIAVKPADAAVVDKRLGAFPHAKVGTVLKEQVLRFPGLRELRIEELLKSYKSTLDGV